MLRLGKLTRGAAAVRVGHAGVGSTATSRGHSSSSEVGPWVQAGPALQDLRYRLSEDAVTGTETIEVEHSAADGCATASLVLSHGLGDSARGWAGAALQLVCARSRPLITAACRYWQPLRRPAASPPPPGAAAAACCCRRASSQVTAGSGWLTGRAASLVARRAPLCACAPRQPQRRDEDAGVVRHRGSQ
jgi:hypothetical protein